MAMVVRCGGVWASARAQGSGDAGDPRALRLMPMVVRRCLAWRCSCAAELSGGPRALRLMPLVVRRCLAWRWACAEELSGGPGALRLLPMVLR